MTSGPKAVTFPIIFAAPSGAGKTSIAHRLQEERGDVEFSISATTRPPRPGEADGVDYHFRDDAEFRAMVERGEMLEWAEVHGNLYGTLGSSLEDARRRGHFLMLDIDVQGSRQVKAIVPEAVSIFVLPPSGGELADRLIGRASEDPGKQRRRLIASRDELEAAVEFDFVIVNDDLERAVDQVSRIIDSEMHRRSRMSNLDGHLRQLIDQVDDVLNSA